jgi:acyl-CoA synthetase (AMP-forming)/AMP-acid ligase II
MNRVSLNLFERFQKVENAIAIIDNVKSYTYDDLIKKVNLFENELNKAGVIKGDLVLLIADYSFESIAMFLAMFKYGNIIAPINSTNESEIRDRMDVCGPSFVFNLRDHSMTKHMGMVSHLLVDQIREKNISGLILFSSGSTGKPKAMVHDLDNLVASYLDKKLKSLVFMVFLMFDHIGGLNTLFNCLAMGATIVIPKNRKPDEIADLIQKFKINILPASPTFLNLMIIAKVSEIYNLSSLKLITYGTEPMPESLLKKLKYIFPSVKLLQTFGTSETGIIRTVSKSSESTFLKLDDPNQEYKIVNGELWLRSKTQIMGYLNNNMDSFSDDGWFKTGDLVQQTPDGFIKIIGRLKEVINVGGEKVLPTEVESVILELPLIEDCTVFGLPNAITGQLVSVNIVLKEPIDKVVIKSIIKQHCASKLEKYKVPVKIQIVSKLNVSERYKKIRDNGNPNNF